MVIKASSAGDVAALVADLGSDEVVRREAAIARLRVLGPRAVERLLALLDSPAPAPTRIAALRILEAGTDPRSINPALHAMGDTDEGVAKAAVAALRVFLRGERGPQVVDHLTAVALDQARLAPVRVAAIGVLADLEPSTVAPLMEALREDPSEAVRAAANPATSAGRPRSEAQPGPHDPVEEVERAAGGADADPVRLRHAIARAATTAPLATLLRVVERAREREATSAAGSGEAAEWMAVRGAAHVALAGRGSRIGVYDLRESLESAAPEGSTASLPMEWLAALSMAGDPSCLEPMAAAWARSRDDWWRQHLADAFRHIVARERLTRRHAVIKKVEKRWPGIL